MILRYYYSPQEMERKYVHNIMVWRYTKINFDHGGYCKDIHEAWVGRFFLDWFASIVSNLCTNHNYYCCYSLTLVTHPMIFMECDYLYHATLLNSACLCTSFSLISSVHTATMSHLSRMSIKRWTAAYVHTRRVHTLEHSTE